MTKNTDFGGVRSTFLVITWSKYNLKKKKRLNLKFFFFSFKFLNKAKIKIFVFFRVIGHMLLENWAFIG